MSQLPDPSSDLNVAKLPSIDPSEPDSDNSPMMQLPVLGCFSLLYQNSSFIPYSAIVSFSNADNAFVLFTIAPKACF